MSADTERRVFPRYLAVSFPIMIEAPSLSDFMLFPVNISLSGYKVVVSECPAVGDLFDCSVEVKGKLFEECHGRVARVIENEATPPNMVRRHGTSAAGRSTNRLRRGHEKDYRRKLVAPR